MENLEFEKEFIEKHSLTDDAVKEITELSIKHTDNIVADTKKEYDGKANDDTQAILEGVFKTVQEETKVDRNKGEKMADYYLRAWTESSTTRTKELEDAKNDYLEKAKNVEGNEGLTKELEDIKGKYDDAQKLLADYDDTKATADKYGPLAEEHDKMKMQVAFSTVMPSFPKEVDEYRAKAKWDEFKKSTLSEWNIELVEGEAIAISKENEHKREKLKDLLDNNEPITKLLEGRKQKGTGGKETELRTVEGIPFDVPVDADNKKISEIINKHLDKENISAADPKRAGMFKSLHDKIKEPQTA